MIKSRINAFVDKLQSDNHYSFYLAFLRVATSLWLLKEFFINRNFLQFIYGDEGYMNEHGLVSLKFLHVDLSFLRNYYYVVIPVYCFALVLNIFGIGKRYTSITAFVFLFILQRLNDRILDGGNLMVYFLLLYLAFADTFQYFVWKKNKTIKDERQIKNSNLISNLLAYSIMLQLCLIYASAGIDKLLSPLWYKGEAVYYTLQNEIYMGFQANIALAHNKCFVYCSTYFTLFVELLFPIFIWFKKTKKVFMLMGALMHIGIYLFMMIYGFQVVFILVYGIFFTNEEWREMLKMKSGNMKINPTPSITN